MSDKIKKSDDLVQLSFYIVLMSAFTLFLGLYPVEEPVLRYFFMIPSSVFLVICICGMIFHLFQRYREKERNSPPFKRYKPSYYLWKYGGICGFLIMNPIALFIMIGISVWLENGYAFLLLIVGAISLHISIGCVDEDMKMCKKCKVLYGNKPSYCGKCGKSLERLEVI